MTRRKLVYYSVLLF